MPQEIQWDNYETIFGNFVPYFGEPIKQEGRDPNTISEYAKKSDELADSIALVAITTQE